MRDWTAYVRERLDLDGLRWERSERIVRELAEHLEDEVRAAMAGGASEEEAEARALRQVPSWETFAAELRRGEGRAAVPAIERRLEDSGSGLAADLFRDLLQGVRQLRQRPGFAAAAVLILGLGIGATTTVFSVVRGVLLRPLPYDDPERLVMLRVDAEETVDYPGMSAAEVEAFEEGSRLFEAFGRAVGFTVGLTAEGDMEQVDAATISDGLLPMLGVRPVLGRGFGSEDRYAENGQYPSVLISHELWQRRFAGDPAVVGRPLEVDNRARTIVGVLPEGFRLLLGPGANVAPRCDVLVPLTSDRRFVHVHVWRTIGRLRPGASLAEAEAEVDAIGNRVMQDLPDAYGTERAAFRLTPLARDVVRDVRPVILTLFAAAAFVLLIACANVANLQIARGLGRRKELAIRTSLGATRGRIVRQVVTENLLLGLLAGGVGLAIATLGLRLLPLLPADVPRLDDVRLDAAVLAFAAAVSAASGLLFGLLPAWRAARPELVEMLRSAGRGLVPGHLYGGLLVLEVAVSLVLLAGAGLLVRTLLNLRQIDLGFEPAPVLTFRMSLDSERLPTVGERRQLYERLADELRALPGVEAVGGIRRLPLQGDEWGTGFARGEETEKEFLTRSAAYNWVVPGFFETMGIDVVHGRAFTDRDNQGERPVVIVDEDLAHELWGEADPIGRQLLVDLDFGRFDLQKAEVVGVVEHVISRGLRDRGRAQLYLPYSVLRNATAMVVVVRTSREPLAVAGLARATAEGLGGGRPVHGVRTLASIVDEATAETRFALLLLALLAGTALVLAAVGALAVISHSVGRRTQEIGVRMALGARQRTILVAVVAQGSRLALAGVAIGLAATIALSRYLDSLLYGVAPRDPLTLAGTSLVLLAITALACLLPALRAARVDPTVALRSE